MDFRSRRFDRAARSYERVTPVQSAMAHRLSSLLPLDRPRETVLELGCGTGHLTRELLGRFPTARFLVTDLAPRMLTSCSELLGQRDRERVRFDLLDARAPRHPETFDLVTSSAVVQWFPDLPAHFRACRHLLRPGGVYALSGFCRTNFPELGALLSNHPWHFADTPGHLLSSARAAAEAAGFEVHRAEEEAVERIYPSAHEFLRSIAQSGASRAPQGGRPLTRKELRLLLSTYEERYSTSGGVRATWKPWFLVLGTPTSC